MMSVLEKLKQSNKTPVSTNDHEDEPAQSKHNKPPAPKATANKPKPGTATAKPVSKKAAEAAEKAKQDAKKEKAKDKSKDKPIPKKKDVPVSDSSSSESEDEVKSTRRKFIDSFRSEVGPSTAEGIANLSRKKLRKLTNEQVRMLVRMYKKTPLYDNSKKVKDNYYRASNAIIERYEQSGEEIDRQTALAIPKRQKEMALKVGKIGDSLKKENDKISWDSIAIVFKDEMHEMFRETMYKVSPKEAFWFYTKGCIVGAKSLADAVQVLSRRHDATMEVLNYMAEVGEDVFVEYIKQIIADLEADEVTIEELSELSLGDAFSLENEDQRFLCKFLASYFLEYKMLTQHEEFKKNIKNAKAKVMSFILELRASQIMFHDALVGTDYSTELAKFADNGGQFGTEPDNIFAQCGWEVEANLRAILRDLKNQCLGGTKSDPRKNTSYQEAVGDEIMASALTILKAEKQVLNTTYTDVPRNETFKELEKKSNKIKSKKTLVKKSTKNKKSKKSAPANENDEDDEDDDEDDEDEDGGYETTKDEDGVDVPDDDGDETEA